MENFFKSINLKCDFLFPSSFSHQTNILSTKNFINYKKCNIMLRALTVIFLLDCYISSSQYLKSLSN